MTEVGRVSGCIDRKVAPVDAVIAWLAARQHGVVAAWQLLPRGITRDEIRGRVRNGRLHPLYRAVYAVGHTSVSAHGRVLAAVLAHGVRAMASHRTSSWVWNLLWDARARIDVTVLGRCGGARRRGITLHRPRNLAEADRAIRNGIPCTSVARTLLDVAASEPPRLLRRAFEEAERQRVLDMREIERVLSHGRGHAGVTPLARLAEEATVPPPMTRSELEEAFRELCCAAAIPPPAMNVPFGDYELDAVWFDERVVVEIDHYATHGHRAAFERDRARDVDLHLARFLPARVTEAQILRPHETGPRLRRLLARGRELAVAA